jgi:hypothetical protein
MRRMALERGAWGPERWGKGTAPAEGHSAPSRPRLACYRHALHHARRVSCDRSRPGYGGADPLLSRRAFGGRL